VQFKRYVVALVAGSLLALGLAIWISPRRRRTTLQFGILLSLPVVALTVVLRAVRTQLIDQVPAGVYRAGADAGVQIVSPHSEGGNPTAVAGILIAVVGYLVVLGVAPWRCGTGRSGPGTSCRARPPFRRGVIADGPGFAHAHLDPLRIGGVVAAGIALIFFTSWAGLFWILVLLGLYELLLTAVAAVGGGPGPGQPSPQTPDQGQTSRSSGLTA